MSKSFFTTVARVNVSRNAFFSSRSEKNIFFDVDIVVKKKQIECGLALSVLLSTTIRVISGQNLLWTHSDAPRGYTRVHRASPQQFDHCDDAYRCRTCKRNENWFQKSEGSKIRVKNYKV